jgi:cytochrome oxidase Cu insertion factor (SCO1/SenC/PrrC family)
MVVIYNARLETFMLTMRSKPGQSEVRMKLTIFSIIAVGLLGGGAALAFLSRAAPADFGNPMSVNVPAPELVGDAWLNAPNNTSISLASRRGKVTIVHFWTFG